MVDFATAIRSIAPDANPGQDGNCGFAWEPDRGFYIARWDEATLGPQPTAEQIAAAMSAT